MNAWPLVKPHVRCLGTLHFGLFWVAFAAQAVFAQTAPNTPATAPMSIAVASGELQLLEEQYLQKLDTQSALQQKDTEALRQQTAAVDKRVDDLKTDMGQGVDRLGVNATILGILVTVLLAGLGVLGFISVTRRTKAEAQDAAKAWFDEQAASLKKQIAVLEQGALQVQAQLTEVAKKARNQMAATALDVHTHAEEAKSEITEAKEILQANIFNTDESQPISPQQQAASELVQLRASELKKTPEVSYSFDDWNTRAHAAYAGGEFEESIVFWRRATLIPSVSAAKVAEVLFNIGFAQSELGQHEAAVATFLDLISRFAEANDVRLRKVVAAAMVNMGIEQAQLGNREAAMASFEDVIHRFGSASETEFTEVVARAMVSKGVGKGETGDHHAAVAAFDEVVHKFGDVHDTDMRKTVANAMNNKGVAHCKLGQSEAAITTFDELITRIGVTSEAGMRELVAGAMFGKGVEQDKLGHSEAALATYGELISRFGEATEAGLREPVVKAMNGLGFAQLCEAKATWQSNPEQAHGLLKQALDHFEKAIERLDPERVNGLILGNRAYALALLGDIPTADLLFAKALRAPGGGGQALYDGTLTDFTIHPIPEDLPIREMVERLWREWQAEQGGQTGKTVSATDVT